MADKLDFTEVHAAGGYGSEFEYDSEADRRRIKYNDLSSKQKKTKEKVGHKRELEVEYSKEEGRAMRFQILSMDAFARHKKFVNDYIMYYSGDPSHFKRDTSRDKTDLDIIRENHKFLWTEEDGENNSWEKRMAKKYYDKLFKEYCITDLSRYKENKIALRWRIEKEVVDGKGQFACGNKKCKERGGLRTWEVNFAYMEDSQKKNALVKLRLCPDCSYKLNYHHRKKEVTAKKKSDKRSQESSSGKRRKADDDRDVTDSRLAPGGGDTSTESHQSKPQDAEQPESSKSESEIWSGPAKITDEKSRDEEFDDYFEDMFL